MASWRDYLENILIAVFLALVVRTFVLTGYKVPTSSMAPTLLPGDFIFSYRLPYGVKIPLTNQKIAINPPKRGDVVVFTYPDQPRVNYVKRVVALPGDRVQIENGELILNGEKFLYDELSPEQMEKELQDLPNVELFRVVNERASGGSSGDSSSDSAKEKDSPGSRWVLFQKSQKSRSFGPFIVPPNEVFLLGDNRDSSDDSRYWGTVPIERIEGRVVWIWLSLNWQKKIWENRVPTLRWQRIGISPH
jgi:signal peptidase I